MVLIGLAAAAAVVGSGAAARPTLGLRAHARLRPVTGTTAEGRFAGVLARNHEGSTGPAAPRSPSRWHLTWTLRLPSLHRSASAKLRIGTEGSSKSFVRLLCRRCAARTKGTITLTESRALRIAESRAVVVVRARSATLRGVIKATPLPAAKPD